MAFKFEQLEVWQLSLKYIDSVYEIAEKLPRSEDFNLKSQITHAATSIALNIAEGSTGQSDPQQNRFLGLAVRSLIETVACLRIIQRRNYLNDHESISSIDLQAQMLAKKLQPFRKSLKTNKISEENTSYITEDNSL